MRRMLLVAVGLAAAVGCRSNTEGPLEVRKKGRPDQPGYTIEQQEARGRERYTIPSDDRRLYPSGEIGGVDPIGRGTSPAAGRWLNGAAW